MAYVVLSDLKTHLGIAEGTDDVILQAAIDAVKAADDHYCDMPYEATSATRYYKASDLGPQPGMARVAGDVAPGAVVAGSAPSIACATASVSVAREDRGQRDFYCGQAEPIAGTAVRAAAKDWKFERGGSDCKPSFRTEYITFGIQLWHPIGQKRV